MDRVEADGLRLDRRFGQLLAGRAVDAIPRTISTRPAPPASTTPASRRTSSSSGVRESASSPRASTTCRSTFGWSPRCSLRSLSSAISRMTVSIVPSTGASPRGTRRRSRRGTRGASARAVDTLVSPEHLGTKPRTICEKMTPELPRAPMSAARVTSFATASLSAAVDASSASTIERSVRTRFVPVSPSGTG